MKKISALVLLLVCLLGAYTTSLAAITVNPVIVTVSTCPNNGTATIHANSNSTNAIFLYDIVSGPVTYPQQNDSVFHSLYPGSYVGKVHDVNSFDSAQFSFTITGTYVNPQVSAQVIQPVCVDSTGIIIGHLVPGTGLGPYQWQIYQPDSSAWLQSDTFKNLPMNNYVIRVKDVCGIARIANAFVDSGGINISNLLAQIIFTKCDTARLVVYFYEDSAKAHLPVTLTAVYGSDTVVTSLIPVQNATPGHYTVSVILNNINLGEILKVTLTDACGDIATLPDDSIPSFNFKLTFNSGGHNCVNQSSAQIFFSQALSQTVYQLEYFLPITFVLTNANTGALIDSFQNNYGSDPNGPCPLCHGLPAEPDSIPFILTAHDACGNTFSVNVHYPPSPPPSVQISLIKDACLDSTTAFFIITHNLSSNATVSILSGPPLSTDNRPGFSYHDTLVYPIVYTNVAQGNFLISNVPVGRYVLRIADSCGFALYDTISVLPSQVQFFSPDPIVHHHCDGTATITLGIDHHNNSYPNLINLSTHNFANRQFQDSLYYWPNLQPGRYQLIVIYSTFLIGTPCADSLLRGNDFCWTYYDTLVLPAYNDSTFKATDIADCNGTIYLHVEVDSANGIPPFKYEIISGPRTFAPQDTANFVVYNFGTYLIGVIDSCGNIDARYITVDTGRIDPVVQAGGLCAGGYAVLTERASPYFTYTWYGPHGQLYYGSTININPLTVADTGTYTIKKVVRIDGCSDSAYGTYHLTLSNTFSQTVSACPGKVVHVGNAAHILPGVYIDTLTGFYGCDSIEITTLVNLPAPIAQLNDDGTGHCHLGTVALYAAGGVSYVWGDGNTSGIEVVLPMVTTIYSLTATGANGCTASASDTVCPATNRTSLFISHTVCQGDTFYYNSVPYWYAGTFPSVAHNPGCGCDTTVYLTIYVVSKPQVSITTSVPPVCHSGTVTLTATSGYTYRWNTLNQTQSITVLPATPTWYYVTATNGGVCKAKDSIFIYPAAVSHITLQPNICAGDTFRTNGHVYTQSGVFTDTLTGRYGCDSIVTTALTVYPLPVPLISSGGMNDTCHTGPVTLTASGGTTYLWQPGGSTAASIIVQPSAITLYTVTAINGGICPARKNMTVYPASGGQLNLTPAICTGDTFKVHNHNYTQPGTYTDTLTGIYGCDSIVHTTLTVYAVPVLTISSGNINDTCHTGPVSLTAAGGASYLWAPGGNTSAGITVQPTSITTYTVTAGNGGVCNVVKSITVYPASDSVATISAGATSLCLKGTDTVCAQAGFTGYFWSQGSTTACIVLRNPGNVSVTVTNNYGCVINSQILHISADSGLTPTITSRADTLISSPAATYQWYLNGNILTGETNRSFVALQGGSYTVTVTDGSGCTGQSAAFVITGIDQLTVGHVKVYPNPNNTGTWQVEISAEMLGAQYEVYDAAGKEIYTGYLQNEKNIVHAKLAAGAYMMRIHSNTSVHNIQLMAF